MVDENSGFKTLESMSQAVWYNRWTLNKFKRYLKGDILEVGCGIGNFTKSLLNFGRVFAIDVNQDYITRVAKSVKDKGRIGLGDIEKGKYFFNSRKFDSVVCLNVLEHIKNDKRALKNLFNLLKDDGHLILLVPAHPTLFGAIDQSIGHVRRYKRDELLDELSEVGFSINLVRRLNFSGAIGWWVAQNILKEKSVKEDNIKLFNMFAPLFLSLEDILEPPFGTSILVIAKKK